jgi:hypothetical protein
VTERIGLSSGPPETVLSPPPPQAMAHLAQAESAPAAERRAELAEVVRAHPDWPEGWAALADAVLEGGRGHEVEAYAYFRVGYHRGLDALRRAGWRGSGYVRWAAPENRGFLRCLHGLGRMAQAIGEEPEAERCRLFLRQLDPQWPAQPGR